MKWDSSDLLHLGQDILVGREFAIQTKELLLLLRKRLRAHDQTSAPCMLDKAYETNADVYLFLPQGVHHGGEVKKGGEGAERPDKRRERGAAVSIQVGIVVGRGPKCDTGSPSSI